MFIHCFIISAILLASSVILGSIQLGRYDRTKIITPRIIFIAGAALAAFVWFLPVYCTSDNVQNAHPITLSFLSAIKIFAADGIGAATSVEGAPDIAWWYMLLGNILSLWTPILTFTVVLSLFRSVWSYIHYFTSFKKKTHVFSELNTRSLAMAKMLKESKEGGDCIIAFADIIDKNEEAHLDLVDGAKKINAILFRNDLEAILWAIKKRTKRDLNFYLISNDNGEKIRHAKNIVDRYNSATCSLFIFDNSEESKMLLRSYKNNIDTHPIHIKIARIDDIKLLTYGYLSCNGADLFRKPSSKDSVEIINVTIVGFGSFGAEMFKALLWYCQMPGYKINITIIDRDICAKTRFEAMFPGLRLGEDLNNSNDVRYRIEFRHITFGEKDFIDDVKELPTNNSFFVFMGDDETNMLAIDAIKCAREQAGKFNGKDDGTGSDKFTTVISNADIRALVNEDKSINVINEIDRFFLFKRLEESSFIEDGLNEHKLYSASDTHIIIFGCGDDELFALKTISEHYASKSLQAKIYEKNLSKEEKDRVVSLFPNTTVKFTEPESKESTIKYIKDFYKNANCPPLIVCFEDNGILSPAELSDNGINLIPCTKRVKRIISYLKARDNIINEDHRNGYYLDDYNFYSSLSKALHRKLRERIKGYYSEPYITILSKTGDAAAAQNYKKELAERLKNPSSCPAAEAELLTAAEIEHIRWNAYMLTEGFVFNKKKNKLYKMHFDLVTVDKLSNKDYLNDI
jgi:hypothetical protein